MPVIRSRIFCVHHIENCVCLWQSY